MTGTVTVAGIALRETRTAEQDGQSLTITGREAHPPGAFIVAGADEAVLAAHRNVLGLHGAPLVPVVFTDKEQLTGFYRVDAARSALTKAAGGQVLNAVWQLSLTRLGNDADLEFESRVPTIQRSTELEGVATSFWHAPPVGATSYYTGSTVPASSVVRASADGDVTVHTGIPVDVAPRWTAPAEKYLAGSVRVLFDGHRHAGTVTPPHTSWELTNGLVQVTGAGPVFTISAWDDGAWRSPKGYRFYAAGSLTTAPELTVLRSEPEETILRFTYPTSPGRSTVDLSLRRGARFITGVIKRHAAAVLGINRTAAESVTLVTGGARATSADADGNRFVMGSSRVVGTSLDTAAISDSAVTRFDFFLGHELGASPAAGDAYADLLGQYLGTAGDETRPVRR